MREESYGPFSERVLLKETDEVLPAKAHFEITYRCNIRCVHCYTDPFNTVDFIRRELPLKGILRILDDLASCGVLWLTLSGGEAVVHPHFREIYQAAKARGFVISLLSNATTLTDSLVEFLKRDPPFQLEVSMHGASQNVFDAVTQVEGSYERFRAGIQKVMAAGLPLRLKTNALALNRDELPEIKHFVERLGLSFNLYSAIYPRLDGDMSSTRYRLAPREILAHESADDCNPTSSVTEENSTPRPQDDRLFRCGCGTSSVTINPYGFLRACTFTTQPSYDLNVMTVRQAFAELREQIFSARYLGETLCRECPAYIYCDKNPIMAEYESGSREAPVPHFCEVAYGRMQRDTA